MFFFENPESNTYCIFNSDKISDPIHEEVYIDTDDELKEFLCNLPVKHVLTI